VGVWGWTGNKVQLNHHIAYRSPLSAIQRELAQMDIHSPFAFSVPTKGAFNPNRIAEPD
jgi:hypothetical protein